MKKSKPSLIGVTSLQEAITVLNARRARPIYTNSVNNIFKADMKNPASKMWIEQELRETEKTLSKDEEEDEIIKKKEMGYQQNLKETEGNPSSGGEPKTQSIADKSGVSSQNDGPSLDAIVDKKPPATDGSEGAHAQTGESQLKEAIDKVFSVGSGVDPMNQAVINGMAHGMSKVEADNAASLDNALMEAIFHKMAAKVLVPIFNAQTSQIHNLQETIKVYDQKLEIARKENKGLQEAVQIQPGSNPIQIIAPTPTQQLPTQTLEEHRAEIADKLKNPMYS